MKNLETLEDDELEALGLEIFHLGSPCPFLEAESCSIYEDRPLSCREFLVTSDKHLCPNPTPSTIERVSIPAHPLDALARTFPPLCGRP